MIFQLHPMEIAKQATLIENEFYRSVTPQELLGRFSFTVTGFYVCTVNIFITIFVIIFVTMFATMFVTMFVTIFVRIFSLLLFKIKDKNRTFQTWQIIKCFPG